MRITERDVRLVRDIALSHLLSRDQIIELGYFSSVTRANTRTRELVGLGYLGKLNTAFQNQTLYYARQKAVELVGERVGQLLSSRKQSPQYVQHSLNATNARVYLCNHGAIGWRFEQQARAVFNYEDKSYEVRPDGVAVFSADKLLAVEVDLGHVSLKRIELKLDAYNCFVASRECKRNWGADSFRLLFLTTSSYRASNIARVMKRIQHFDYICEPYASYGIRMAGSWS